VKSISNNQFINKQWKKANNHHNQTKDLTTSLSRLIRQRYSWQTTMDFRLRRWNLMTTILSLQTLSETWFRTTSLRESTFLSRRLFPQTSIGKRLQWHQLLRELIQIPKLRHQLNVRGMLSRKIPHRKKMAPRVSTFRTFSTRTASCVFCSKSAARSSLAGSTIGTLLRSKIQSLIAGSSEKSNSTRLSIRK